MSEEAKDVKKEETGSQDDASKSKSQDDSSKNVPYERFKEVNDERNAFKQKAEALDALWNDPDFQGWLKDKESGKTKDDAKAGEDDDQPLTRGEFKKLTKQFEETVVKPLTTKTESKELDDAVKEVKAMEVDDTKFPFFKPWGTSPETDKIRQEMINMMEKGEVKTLEKAYRIVTYDLAIGDVTKKHETEATKKRELERVRTRSTVAIKDQGTKMYKSVREAAEDASDKLGY